MSMFSCWHDYVILWKSFPYCWPFMRGTIGHKWIPFTKGHRYGVLCLFVSLNKLLNNWKFHCIFVNILQSNIIQYCTQVKGKLLIDSILQAWLSLNTWKCTAISNKGHQHASHSLITRCHFPIWRYTQIARIMGPTWVPPGSCRPQVGPM